MPASTQFTIGADAVCSDGVCGNVTRVVVDPIAQAVTHLVIEPKHRRGLGRLVPLDLVDAAAEEVRLRCTLSDFARLEIAEETQFLPGSMGYANYGPGQSLSWPYYGLGSALVADDDSESGTSLRRSRSTFSPRARSPCAAVSTSTQPTPTSVKCRES